MATIKLSLEGVTSSLNTVGDVFLDAAAPDADPVCEGVRVKRTEPWKGDLTVGTTYVYVYDIDSGSGAYTLNASFADSDATADSTGPRDASAAVNNRFRFKARRFGGGEGGA